MSAGTGAVASVECSFRSSSVLFARSNSFKIVISNYLSVPPVSAARPSVEVSSRPTPHRLGSWGWGAY